MLYNNENESSNYERTLEEMKKNFDINWFLWRLKAKTEEDVKDFSKFSSLMKESGKGVISLAQLGEMGISINQSRILRTLVREKIASITKNELAFTFEHICEDNLSDFINYVNNYYHGILNTKKVENEPYLSSTFYIIDKKICETIPIQNLSWQSLDVEKYKDKLIEIVFPRFHLPPILLTQTVAKDIISIAKDKIISRLALVASENSNFFSRYIKFDGFSIKTRFPTLYENDLVSIKTKKGQDYQYEYTTIFLEKVFSNQEVVIEYLNAINFEAYSDLGSFFSPSKRENYDFIQSYLIYKEFALPQSENKRNALQKIDKTLLSSLRFYMTQQEVREAILLSAPDADKDFHETVFNEFFEIAQLQEKQQLDFSILYFSIDFFGTQETIFIHAQNFNRYLNKAIGDATEPMEKIIRKEWKKKLLRYNFIPEMFSENQFNDYIFDMIKKKDSILYQILRQKKCYFYLTKLKNINQIANKLVIHGINNISEVIKLNPHRIYQQLVLEIKKEKSFFGRLIFSFLNWYYLRSYQHAKEKVSTNVNVKKNQDSEETKAIFSLINARSIPQINEKCDLLWQELGADQIPRHALERNIKNDLVKYFENRDRVLIHGLEIIFERNSNQIIKQAPHLAVYQQKLNEFIKYYAYKVILMNSSLRNKLQTS